MDTRELAEDFIERTVIVVRTQAPPVRGELLETGSDGIVIAAEFVDSVDGELVLRSVRSKCIFVPWQAIQGIS